MNVSRELKKEEAIKRMKMLDLYKPYIDAFIDRDEIFLSEPTGGVYEFGANSGLCAKIREFEAEYNALVYHVIHTFAPFGELYNFLYVSDYDEEWPMDNADFKYGLAFVYVWNVDDDWCSELGTISITNRFGGLVRIA